MTNRFRKITSVFAFLLTLGLCAHSKEVGGINLEPKIQVQGTELVLNGAGVRYRAFFKVSVTAIYAVKKFTSLDGLIELPGPKRLVITMLRDIPAGGEVLGKTVTRGIEDNYPRTNFSKIVPSMIRMSEIFSVYKTVRQGDRIILDFIPGVGVQISINDKLQGDPFTDAEIFRALMSVFLGPSTADFKLKDALLGDF